MAQAPQRATDSIDPSQILLGVSCKHFIFMPFVLSTFSSYLKPSVFPGHHLVFPSVSHVMCCGELILQAIHCSLSLSLLPLESIRLRWSVPELQAVVQMHDGPCLGVRMCSTFVNSKSICQATKVTGKGSEKPGNVPTDVKSIGEPRESTQKCRTG